MTPADADRLAALLARCGLRDQQAFAELYRLTAAKLFGVVSRILRRNDWAEEVLQDVYVSIWQHAGTYAAAKSAPFTWLTTIARNRALDRLRRPQHELTGEAYQPAIEAFEDDAPGPLERLADDAHARAIARCLAALGPRERQVIALAFFRGLTHSELAAHLGEPLGSVKTWARRGLERLRECLGASA